MGMIRRKKKLNFVDLRVVILASGDFTMLPHEKMAKQLT